MASGTQQHPHQYQQQQQQQPHHHQQSAQHELPMPQQQQQQQSNQMQFTSNQNINSCLDPQQHIQQMGTMSPIAANTMSIDQDRGLMMSMSSQQQPQDQMMHQAVGPSVLSQDMCNQPTTQHHIQPQQKSHLLPLLLSPRPTSLKSADQSDQAQQPDIDHDQIIEQVISLENEYSDLTGGSCMPDSNQLSSSSEDLLNLLLEFDRDSSNMLSSGVQQLDQDEKVGIETIRKQLMSCEVQSDQLNSSPNGMSSAFNQIISSNQQQQVRTTQQSQHNQVHHGVQQQQLISQTAPVISHQQPQHQLSTPGLLQQRQQQLPQHHRLSVDQTLLHGSYSNTHLGNAVPVSSSGHSYNHQQHQSIARISQSTPMSIDNNSPSPSWQQPQLSPYSPQTDPTRPPSQRQHHHPTMQQQHSIQPHQQPPTTSTTTTSPQMQQLHHPSQTRSPSQSISPPINSEPSPVVKKNPLLNAQLVNSRTPSITPTRFINNPTNVLNQNPILNSKLSQSPFVTSSCVTVGSPVNSSLNNPQPTRYIPQQQQQSPHQQQQSNFNYDTIPQQQNAQQHTPPQSGYMSMYGQHGDRQQQTTQMYRASNVTTTANTCSPHGGGPHLIMSSTSPSSGGGGLSQQVKQEIRKKVQQPKQQHQTTSLLKQLLSDDNK